MAGRGVGDYGGDGLLAVRDGRLDGLEVLRAEDDVVVVRGVSFLDGVAEEGGVLMGEDVVHDGVARSREVFGGQDVGW